MRRPTIIEIDASPDATQILAPSGRHRCEGVAFSRTGNILGVVDPDFDSVFLFRRLASGRFDDQPYCIINGPRCGLSYPHDLSFSRSGGSEFLAVGQRTGAIAIFEKSRRDDQYGPVPVFEIRGPETGLDLSDGVAFIPPANLHLAACNLQRGSISIYKRISSSPIRFKLEPIFVLRHPSLANPDGLGFSSCGKWLAVANHGNNTVSVFKRHRASVAWQGRLKFGSEPVAVIEDPGLRCPHSVSFIPKSHHLVVTNAGANFFNIYRHDGNALWSQSPMAQQLLGPDGMFREINSRNSMEGGPKGVAVHGRSIAVCGPEFGVKIYSFNEHGMQALRSAGDH